MRRFGFCLLLFSLQLPLSLSLSTSGLAQDTDQAVLSERLYTEAKVLEKKGASLEAIAKYQESLKIAQESGIQSAIAKNWLAIGTLNSLLGRYDEAKKNLEDARNLGEELNEKGIVARALIQISDLHQRQSRYKESMEIGHQALKMGEELDDPEVICRAYRIIGNNLFYQGQFKQALEPYQKSLKYAEETGDPVIICRSLLVIGNTFTEMGDMNQGIAHLLRAKEKAEEAGDKAMLVPIHSGIGVAYREQAMYEEAINHYQFGLQAVEEVGDKEGKAGLLNNLGVVFREQGSNEQALHSYHEALKLAEELGNQKGVALLLNNIGALYANEGLEEKALLYYERSLKTREQIGDKWGIASVLNNIGLVYENQKKYDQAIEFQQRALKIAEYIGNKERTNLYAQNLGQIYLRLGAYDKATQLLEKALIISKENNAKGATGFALEGIGEVQMELRNYPEAAEFFRQALSLGEEVNRPELLWKSGFGLAKAQQKMGNTEGALRLYEAAINEIEKVRARASSHEGKSGFLAGKLTVYESLIQVLFDLNQQHPEQNFAVQAFEYSERAKARALLDSLAEARSDIRKGLTKEQASREKATLRKISRIQSELWESTTEQQRKEIKKKLLEAEAELDQFVLDLRIHNIEYAQLKYPEPYTLSGIQKELDKNTALLEFFVGEKQSYVFALTSNAFRAASIPGKNQLEDRVKKFRDRISQPPKASLGQNASAFQRDYQQQARALFQLMLAPVESTLSGKRNWILVLDGILHYVPFETLIMDGDRLVVEDFRVSYAPSATIWANLKTEKPEKGNPKELLAFADPLLSPDSTTQQEEDMQPWIRQLGRLRYASQEVQGIASLYPQNLVSLHLAKEATEAEFKIEKSSDYKMIHFATHAVIDEEVSRRSGVVLSAAEKSKEDGVLQMHEIWNLDLNAQLVVLSACQTGLGKLVSGEGMISLIRSFFYAGARNIVVSLWNVDDKSTSQLMKSFYIHMKSGKSKMESLRQAKLDLIYSAKSGSGYTAYQDPYYWAPFVLVGPGE